MQLIWLMWLEKNLWHAVSYGYLTKIGHYCLKWLYTDLIRMVKMLDSKIFVTFLCHCSSAVKQRHCFWPAILGVWKGGQGKVVIRSGSSMFVGGGRATAAEFTKHKTTSSRLKLYHQLLANPGLLLCVLWICPFVHNRESSQPTPKSSRRRPAKAFQQASSKNTILLLWSVDTGRNDSCHLK